MKYKEYIKSFVTQDIFKLGWAKDPDQFEIAGKAKGTINSTPTDR
jgi:hypothetical protein